MLISCTTLMPETLDRCQACRGRLTDNSICPRCGCDFSLARQAIEQAEGRLQHALRALAVGDRELARSQVDASLAMHRQRLAQAIKEFLDSGYMESGHAGHTSWPQGDLQAEGGPDGIRQGDCLNPVSAVQPT